MKVSVVMAVYNAMPYLKQALDTVIGQTLSDIEIICVDDGSTDDSWVTLQNYACRDNRIKVLRHTEKTDGAAAARNMGMEHARGEYLSFLDSDDFFEPDMLEKAYKKAVQTEAEVIVFDGYIFNNALQADQNFGWILEHGYLPKQDVFRPADNANGLFLMTMGAAWNALFRREFIRDNEIRFASVFHTDDQNFTYLAYACANRIAILDERLIHYRKSPKGQSANVRTHPESGYMAPFLLKEELVRRGLYEIYKNSLALRLLKTAKWHLSQMRDKEHYEALYYALKDKYLEELGVYALDANLINLKEDIVWIDYIRHMDSETFLLKWYEDSGGKIITDILNKTPIRYGNTIVIYGAGIRGSYIFHALFAEQAFKIAAWVDKKSEELGYPISAPDCIDKLSFDYVLVAIESVNTYRAVKNYLLSKGIDEKKICWIG